MTKVLYTSDAVRRKIIDIFTQCRGRRIAVVGFVGDGADAYLPHPKGLELICWPQPGSTNPRAIRDLKARGVKIKFADKLHMKVYWAEGKGAVITSANLTTNALGSGDLREVGVFLPASDVNINKLLRGIKCKQADERAIKRLEIVSRRVHHNTHQINQTFGDWLANGQFPTWRIYWWTDYGGAFAKEAVTLVKADYGRGPQSLMYAEKKSDYKQDGWALSFRLNEDTDRATNADWAITDFMIPVSKKDIKAYDRNYPYQAIQIHRLRHYGRPPFRIDRRFRMALNAAVKQYSAQKLRDLKSTKPTKSFLKLLSAAYQ